MIDIGQSAPDFTLSDQHGDPVTLSELPGQRVVERYGGWGEKLMYGRTYLGAQRATFSPQSPPVMRSRALPSGPGALGSGKRSVTRWTSS